MQIEDFLDLPLVARLATTGADGPTVRPIWFLYEDGAFWWLTGSSYSKLDRILAADPRVSLVIDRCDLATGEVVAVTVSGVARVHPFDSERATRKLSKYLGPAKQEWDARFRDVFVDSTSRFAALEPDRPPRLRDLSFTPEPCRCAPTPRRLRE